MNPTVKITLTKTLILAFFALTAFFVLPGGVSAAENKVGDFTVTGDSSGYSYDVSAKTLTVNSGDVTIKNMNPVIPTADKIVVAGVANITLDGVTIDVSNTFQSCAFTVQNNAALNLTLAAGSTNSLTSGTYCAGLNVPDDASLTIDSDSTNPGTLAATAGTYGAGIGGNSGTRSISGAITINGGVISAQGTSGAGIGGASVYQPDQEVISSSRAITINGGSVTAIGSYGAGIGGASAESYGQAATSSCGDVTINGGTVTATGGGTSAGIGGSYAKTGIKTSTSQGGNVVITGGSVKATKAGDARDNIGSGKAQWGSDSGGTENSGTLTNGSGTTVSLVTLTLSGDSVKNKAIDTLTVGGYTGDATAAAAAKKYGIKDMATDAEGKLYLYLPAGDPTEGGLAYATLKDDATNTLYAGSVTGADSSRSAALVPIDGKIDMNTAGGNLYIWNDGYGIGNSSSAAEKAKISYSGNYTLSGTTKANGVAVMPGYDGKTDGQDGYKTITLNGLNIDVSGNENSCAFALSGSENSNNGAIVNLTLAENSKNTLKSASDYAGLQVPETTELTISSHHGADGQLIAQSVRSNVDSQNSAGIGGALSNGKGNSGLIRITGGEVTAISDDSAGIGGSYSREDGSISGDITITGGNVTATSTAGAGIGGGYSWADTSSGAITISGGSVRATSKEGAGIGGGRSGNTSTNGAITISGGSIVAVSTQGAGIGGGYDFGTTTSGSITITGGSVNASSLSNTPTNGSGHNLTLNTLTVGEPVVGDNVAITSTVAGTPQTLSNGYGVKDVKTMDGGKVYFYLPDATGPAAAIEVKAGADATVYSRSYDRANPDTPGGSYDRAKAYTATLLPPASYTITIPETANFGDVSYQADPAEQYKSQPLTVSGQNFTNLSDGRSLSLSVRGSGQSGAFALTNSQNSLGYEVYKGETATGSPLATGGRLAEDWKTSTEGTPQKALLRLDQSQIKYSGQYKGSLVFTVEMNDYVPLKE